MNYEKRMREDSQNTMYRMIEDMHGKITQEIQNERKERENTEEGLLKLLEETCSRVETGLRDFPSWFCGFIICLEEGLHASNEGLLCVKRVVPSSKGKKRLQKGRKRGRERERDAVIARQCDRV